MLNKSVARRYAEALFAIAQETDKVDEMQKDLELIAETIDSYDELKSCIFHTLIPPREKRDVVNKLFGPPVSEMVLNFYVVIDKRRDTYIGAMAEEYKDMANEYKNVLFADLISAREVSDEDVQVLKEKVAAATGKSVDMEVSIDPSLIGGIKMRIGDRIIDASVKKKLELLRDDLKKARIVS